MYKAFSNFTLKFSNKGISTMRGTKIISIKGCSPLIYICIYPCPGLALQVKKGGGKMETRESPPLLAFPFWNMIDFDAAYQRMVSWLQRKYSLLT